MHRQAIKAEQGMELILEVIFSAFDPEMNLCYRTVKRNISRHCQDPDDLVHEIIREAAGHDAGKDPEKCIIHSTSWRYETSGELILTYLVFSDSGIFNHSAMQPLCLKSTAMPEKTDPSRPRPKSIQQEHVVIHGIRHISHLVKQKSQNYCSVLSTHSILAFQRIESELAGRIY